MALDGSPLGYGALPFATSIAQAADAAIELVCVLDPSSDRRVVGHEAAGRAGQEAAGARTDPRWSISGAPGPAYMSAYSPESEYEPRAEETGVKKWLEDVASGLRERAKVPVETTAAVGNAAEELVAIASRYRHADAILAMATHGRSGLSRGVLGSVTDRVMREATIPVMVVHAAEVPEQETWKPGRIVLPLDGSALSEEALPHAVDLANLFKVPVLLLRVVLADTGDPQGEARGYLERTSRQLELLGVQTESQLRPGDPAEEILGITENTPSTIAVMSTHGLSGIKRLVIGSVTDRVVTKASVPVLVVRPDQDA